MNCATLADLWGVIWQYFPKGHTRVRGLVLVPEERGLSGSLIAELELEFKCGIP